MTEYLCFKENCCLYIYFVGRKEYVLSIFIAVDLHVVVFLSEVLWILNVLIVERSRLLLSISY